MSAPCDRCGQSLASRTTVYYSDEWAAELGVGSAELCTACLEEEDTREDARED